MKIASSIGTFLVNVEKSILDQYQVTRSADEATKKTKQ